MDVNLNDYNKVRILSNGSTSKVYLYEHKETKNPIIFKSYCVNGFKNSDTSHCFIQESSKLFSLYHPCILPIEGIVYDEKKSRILLGLKFASNGTINNECIGNLSITSKYCISLGIASALKYIKQKGVLHGKLSPNHVLLDNNNLPMICDFSFPKSSSIDVNRFSTISCLPYMSPEIINGSSLESSKSDVFSFGLILYELLTNQSPFDKSASPIQQAHSFSQGNRPPIPDTLNEFCRNLIINCWSNDPRDRPSPEELFQTLVENPKLFINDNDIKLAREYAKVLLDYDRDRVLSELGDPSGAYGYGKVLFNMSKSHHYSVLALERIEFAAKRNINQAVTFLDGLKTKTSDLVLVDNHIETKDLKVHCPELVKAASLGNIEQIKSLLIEDADINTQNDEGVTFLIMIVL